MKHLCILTLTIVIVGTMALAGFAQVTINLHGFELPTIDGRVSPLIQNANTVIYVTHPDCKYCKSFEENALSELVSLLDASKAADFAIVAYGEEEMLREKYTGDYPKVFLGTEELKKSIDFKGYPSFLWVSKNGDILDTKLGFPPNGTIGDIHFLDDLFVSEIPISSRSIFHIPGIEVITGPIIPEDLAASDLAIFFFLPEGCPACNITDKWFEGFIESDVDLDIVFVTQKKSAALMAWIDQYPDRNVWIDTTMLLSSHFRVHEVPSIYLMKNGQLITKDVWPFSGGLEGLGRVLEYFEAGGFDIKTPKFLGTSLPYTGFRSIEYKTISTTAMDLPALLFFYSSQCEPSLQALSVTEKVLRKSNFGLSAIYLASLEGDSNVKIDIPESKTVVIEGTTLIDVLNIKSYPMLLLLDSNGTVVWEKIGYSDNLENNLICALNNLH